MTLQTVDGDRFRFVGCQFAQGSEGVVEGIEGGDEAFEVFGGEVNSAGLGEEFPVGHQ